MGSYPRVLLVLVLLASAVAGSVPALAEEPPRKGIEVRVPPPPRAPGVRFEPGQPREIDRVRQEEYYPERIRARHEPAFLAPLTVTVPTGPGTAVRAGLAGWTAPRVPSDDREATGAAAFGFTLRWGIPSPTEEGVEPGR
ncbi:MAG: hypothetical protein HYY19_03990 [Candidatus Rokubacteria bacterium]|nr:hypothetical protein [Candidatus Rokubacteria bacterium]